MGSEILKEEIIDVEEELLDLEREIADLDKGEIPFDKWDFSLAFALGVLEVAGDFLLSDHNQTNSVAMQMSDGNTPLGKAFQSVHGRLKHSGHPIDWSSNDFDNGLHRGSTWGHDLLMFVAAIHSLKTGQFNDGYFVGNIYHKVTETAHHATGATYATMQTGEAIIAYFTHMAADFFSKTSLPIPGFSLLTHFPQEEIRNFAKQLYADGLNLRNLLMQGAPVAAVEFGAWLYTALRYSKEEYTKEQAKNKREKLLLLSHGVATAVNIGKVVITKEITSLNLPMIIRTVSLVFRVLKKDFAKTGAVYKKVELSTLKNRFEGIKTLILAEKCVEYSQEQKKEILALQADFEQTNQERVKKKNGAKQALLADLEQLKKKNRGEE